MKSRVWILAAILGVTAVVGGVVWSRSLAPTAPTIVTLEPSRQAIVPPDPNALEQANSPAQTQNAFEEAASQSTIREITLSKTETALPAPISQPPPLEACVTAPDALKVTAPPMPKIITGRVGLYVARFAKGTLAFVPDKVIQIHPEWQFPLASNFKTAVWLETIRQLQAGSLKPNEKFVVTRANQSLGDYPFDNTPVLELGRRMIEWSDNTATDMLFRRIGLEKLQPLADNLRLCNTRLQLPTKTWWVAQAGFGGPDFPKYALRAASKKFAEADFETRLEMAKRLDGFAQKVAPDKLNAAVETYFAGRNGGPEAMGEIDRNLQNASTPQEWARFLFAAFVNNNLEPKWNQKFREIMTHGKGRYYLKVPMTFYGGKSGNTARVLTYSGYLETKSGDRLIYVYMNDTSLEIATRDQTPQAFYWINAALRKLMRPEDLKPAPTVKAKKN